MKLRARHAIQYACDGFEIDVEKAIDLINSSDKLSGADAEKRKILFAAFDNLIDFAVAEQYQMISELPQTEDENINSEDIESCIAVFSKYNKQYAQTENSDIKYALIIAASLLYVKHTTMLTYMTMGDERVRPWHRAFEGYTAPKASFPAWLIPPIEHRCRCFLIHDDYVGQAAESVQAKQSTLEIPDWFNRTFKESVAQGGRIFSDEHPYFTVQSDHMPALQSIANEIKSSYFHASN